VLAHKSLQRGRCDQEPHIALRMLMTITIAVTIIVPPFMLLC